MRSLRPVIASNGLAIALTILFVLPITGVLAYVVTTPLDAWMENLGVWLHEANGWSASLLDTQERFAKVGFAIRSIVIAVVEGELTVKRLYKKDGRLALNPENPEYRPIHIHEDMELIIWGVVSGVTRKL